MDKILVHGGRRLSGSIKISGSKNSSLPILAATLLTREPCVIHGVPDLSDTNYMLQILAHLGAQVERASGTVTVTAGKIHSVAPYDVVRKMRASVCVLGPLLGRCKEASVALPGGCVIGDRPIDLHLKGFEALGSAVRVEGGDIKVFAPKLAGAEIDMRGKFGPTVLGTDNVMMAAVLAEGVTVIEGAACEPEVVDLANFLNEMGAKIEGAGTSTISIEGVRELHGTGHRIIPDRIEAGTFAIAAAITGGNLEIEDCCPSHLDEILRQLRQTGVRITQSDDTTLRVEGTPKLHAVSVSTRVYPGFATDMQAQYMALMTQAEGDCEVTETIFENRFMHASELQRLGANVRTQGRSAFLKGPSRLTGARIMASDLRASASLVLAGLVADGETLIDRVYHIDRGYERIEEKLRAVGAKIDRLKDDQSIEPS